MLFAGTRRDGFKALTPERRRIKLITIATTATIRNARSRGSPNRSSERLAATRISPRETQSRTPPTTTAMRLDGIPLVRSPISARKSDNSTRTSSRTSSRRSRSSRAGRIGQLILPISSPIRPATATAPQGFFLILDSTSPSSAANLSCALAAD